MRGDLRWETIPGLVEDAARRFAGRPAVVDGPVRLSHEELAARVRRAAAAMIGSGVRKGDRVAVWAANSHQWLVAAFGAMAAGAVLVPLNTRFKGPEAASILEKSRARLLLVSPPFLGNDYPGMLRAACGPAGDDGSPCRDLPHLRSMVVLGSAGWERFLAEGDAVPAALVAERSAAVSPDDVSDIFFTSGTTGRPKGVMTSHAQNLRVFDTWAEVAGLAARDRYLIVNPFFHTFGFKAGALACLMRGATIIPQAVFDPAAVLDTVAAERVTVLPGPPTLYLSLLDHPGRAARDLSSLRLAVTGAAVVPLDLVRRIRADLGFETVITAYGLTEATGTVTMCRRDDPVEVVAGTSGRAIPGTRVRAVTADGREAAPGEPGEIRVRGHNVMRGYFEDPEATAEAVDADGWLRTGDVGTVDENGRVRITDRVTDMFTVGGFNVYPAEVERVLAGHERIAEVAVVGVADSRLGEVGLAAVVPRPGRRPDPEEIIRWSRERMANYKVPRRVELVDELPRNAAGKVLKHRLLPPPADEPTP
jgi:HIP---CoA ligase